MSIFEYEDVSGESFAFQYIVTQSPDEGPEYVLYINMTDPNATEWKRWPEDMPLPNEVSGHFHGELIPSDYDVPGMFETFSALRAARDELVDARLNEDLTTKPKLAQAIEGIAELIAKIGDLDEPWAYTARDALAGKREARGQLDRLSDSNYNSSAFDSK